MNDTAFKKLILSHWRRYGRHDLPWRRTRKPYNILVSEIMLQQTQVPRVIHKYREFLAAFPTFRELAAATTGRVLNVWQGLGYNRRALMLHRCAREVVDGYKGKLPRTFEALQSLPGIGPYTAGAVLAFAFNKPHPVIETNIRRVYLHHLFPRRRKVPDSEILPHVARHVSSVPSPRDWYSALMDYGTHLSQHVSNPNRRSRHYTRQPSFEGSLRQLRGRILRELTLKGPMERVKLATQMKDIRMSAALAALEKEGFIRVAAVHVRLAT